MKKEIIAECSTHFVMKTTMEGGHATFYLVERENQTEYLLLTQDLGEAMDHYNYYTSN